MDDFSFNLNLNDGRFNTVLKAVGKLFSEYAEAERKTEVLRQMLTKLDNFDAYAAFRRITADVNGGIMMEELAEYLLLLQIQATPSEINLLFKHLDFDGDKLIGWTEF